MNSLNEKKQQSWFEKAKQLKSPERLAKEVVDSMTLEQRYSELYEKERDRFKYDATLYEEEIERRIYDLGEDRLFPVLEKLESRELGFYAKWENRYTLIIDFVKHEKAIKETYTMENPTSEEIEQYLTQMYAKDFEQMDLPELIKLAGMVEEVKQAKEAKLQWLSSVEIFR